MDPDNIIFYGDLFFNHIIYELGVHEVLNLLFVSKKFYKSIINLIIDQIVWKIYTFEGIDPNQIRTVITNKNTILTGNFVVSCVYDICQKNRISILNVGTYNPWKRGFQNSKYEDYEEHKFEQLMLKIQCVNAWEYKPIEKLFDWKILKKNMTIWIDRAGCIEGPAIIMDKQNSIHNLKYSQPFDSKYSEYNFLSIKKNHPYLKNFNEKDLYPEFNDFVKCIKRYEFKIYEIHNFRYYINTTTGHLDIVCQLVNHLDECEREFGKNIYKTGRICGNHVELHRAEMCEKENCPLRQYGGINNKHYHFFDNKGYGDYAEYVFVEK